MTHTRTKPSYMPSTDVDTQTDFDCYTRDLAGGNVENVLQLANVEASYDNMSQSYYQDVNKGYKPFDDIKDLATVNLYRSDLDTKLATRSKDDLNSVCEVSRNYNLFDDIYDIPLRELLPASDFDKPQYNIKDSFTVFNQQYMKNATLQDYSFDSPNVEIPSWDNSNREFNTNIDNEINPVVEQFLQNFKISNDMYQQRAVEEGTIFHADENIYPSDKLDELTEILEPNIPIVTDVERKFENKSVPYYEEHKSLHHQKQDKQITATCTEISEDHKENLPIDGVTGQDNNDKESRVQKDEKINSFMLFDCPQQQNNDRRGSNFKNKKPFGKTKKPSQDNVNKNKGKNNDASKTPCKSLDDDVSISEKQKPANPCRTFKYSSTKESYRFSDNLGKNKMKFYDSAQKETEGVQRNKETNSNDKENNEVGDEAKKTNIYKKNNIKGQKVKKDFVKPNNVKVIQEKEVVEKKNDSVEDDKNKMNIERDTNVGKENVRDVVHKNGKNATKGAITQKKLVENNSQISVQTSGTDDNKPVDSKYVDKQNCKVVKDNLEKNANQSKNKAPVTTDSSKVPRSKSDHDIQSTEVTKHSTVKPSGNDNKADKKVQKADKRDPQTSKSRPQETLDRPSTSRNPAKNTKADTQKNNPRLARSEAYKKYSLTIDNNDSALGKDDESDRKEEAKSESSSSDHQREKRKARRNRLVYKHRYQHQKRVKWKMYKNNK